MRADWLRHLRVPTDDLSPPLSVSSQIRLIGSLVLIPMVTAIPMVIKLVSVVLLLGIQSRPIPARKKLPGNYFKDVTRNETVQGPSGTIYRIYTANAIHVATPAVSSVIIIQQSEDPTSPRLRFYHTTFYNDKLEKLNTTAYAEGAITIDEVYKSKVGGEDYHLTQVLNLPDPPGDPNGTNIFSYPMTWSTSPWSTRGPHTSFYNSTWYQDDSRVGLMLEADYTVQDLGHNYSYHVEWNIMTGTWPPNGGPPNGHLFHVSLAFKATNDGIEQAGDPHRTFVNEIWAHP
ncbi:hypothetical protein FOL47_009707 [Perkinsus chesapeaki]|uniref:Uncharacterized protein n=1 Tax=Perkinsus chesapeaki TaxID=330153 RepID=A0A7J6L6P5_PERCH|nr:hypothetical protein FOL47_009707 [Perkinsus chesapeaki]